MLSRWEILPLFAGLALAVVIGSSRSSVAANETPASKEGPEKAGRLAQAVVFLSEDDLNRYRKEIEKNSAALGEYEQLLDEARAALAEYRKAIGIHQSGGAQETTKKVLEVLASAGLAVAAIFFGFFGFLVGTLPGLQETKDGRVRTTYWWAALWTGIGVLVSLSTSVFAILALGDVWGGAAAWSIRLAVVTGLLVFLVTAYFLVTLGRK